MSSGRIFAGALEQLTPLQRATFAVKEMRARLEAATGARTEPIAIVGMACRFPGGMRDPERFWEQLRAGADAITEVPRTRWHVDDYYDPDPAVPGKMYTRWGGFVEGVDAFDAQFFGISPREAVGMDPQQRLLLEVAWEALEDAGQVLERLPQTRTGVFVGWSHSDYERLQVNPDQIGAYSGTGTAASVCAGRLSYFLGLQGPSLVVDTACSSSLVALHLSVQSLRAGECSLALAGGVNLVLWPLGTVYFCKLRAMAPDGRCKVFDARADGYVRGEGCGVVVLKRLSDALADGDRILALVRGTAVNHDGHSSGLTVPNGLSQQAVIRGALAAGAVDPAQVGYVEAHGTGTALGDPIEVRALSAVFRPGRPDGRELVVGSVKTNIGHLEAAAGVAGLIKTVLALRHGEIPPHLHFQRLNPNISFDGLPVVIPVAPTPWPWTGGRRVAGVSSFGFGGTNAHAVLEEAPVAPGGASGGAAAAGRWHLLPVSARSPAALRALAEEYRKLLAGDRDPVGDVCYTAAVRRSHHDHRLVVIGRTSAELAAALAGWLSGARGAGVSAGRREPGRPRRIGFVFSGQGSQWAGMGRELLEGEPVFRAAAEACEAEWRKHSPTSLLDTLRADAAEARLDQTEVAQPAIFAVQVSLAALYRSWGIEPAWVVGHSVGEIAAAHVAGILSLGDAMCVAYHRGRLMQRGTGQGAMAAVGLDREAAAARVARFGGALSVAAENAPGSTVLSGDVAALEAVLEELRAEGVFAKRLEVDYGFHSLQMEPFQAELAEALGAIRPRAAVVPMVSTVTGRAVDGSELDGAYWAREIREPVRFAEGLREAARTGGAVVVEVGPHPVLGKSVREVLEADGRAAVVLATLRKGREARPQLMGTLGALFALGAPVDWTGVYPTGCLVPLPAYPWQREPCWLDPAHSLAPAAHSPGGPHAALSTAAHPLLGAALPELASLPGTRTWETELSLARFPWIAAHALEGAAVVPFTTYVEMALAAGEAVFGTGPQTLSGLAFHKLLFLPAGGGRRVQVSLAPAGPGEATFQMHSAVKGGLWELNATGNMRVEAPAARSDASSETPEQVRTRCSAEVGGREFYAALRARGPAFPGIQRVWRRDGEALAYVRVPAEGNAARFHAHPALLSACFQALPAALPAPLLRGGSDWTKGAWVVAGVRELRVHGSLPSGGVWSHATVRGGGGDGELEGDLRLLDESGALLARAVGVRLRRIGDESAPGAPGIDDLHYDLRWERVETAADAEDAGGEWVILTDRSGVGQALAATLGARGGRCTVVESAAWFGAEGPRLETGGAGSMLALLESASGGAQRLRGVVHLWSLDAPRSSGADLAAVEAAQALGVASAVDVLQALGAVGSTARVWLVTRGVHNAGEGAAGAEVLQAPLWGAGRSAAVELAGRLGALVDLDPEAPPERAAVELAAALLVGGAESQLAVRRGSRYAARLVRRPPAAAPAPPLRFRADAAYLVTGGLGDLGLEVARWMAAHGARHLVLVGRTALPPRDRWDAAAVESSEARRIAGVRDLERGGARVRTAAADVADEGALQALLKELAADGWPAVRGVFHTAGVVRGGLLRDLDRGALADVLRPKVAGGWALHRVFEHVELDFFVLFSSIASVLGWLGQGAAPYAAANAFSDALAFHRRAQGLPALSVGWGPWAEVGIAARTEGALRGLDRLGVGAVTPRRALAALERLLGEGPAYATVVEMDWPRFFRANPDAGVAPLLSALAAECAAGPSAWSGSKWDLSRELLLREGPEEARRMLETQLREQVARVLRLPPEEVDADLPVTRMGLDSLMAIEIKTEIQNTFNVSIPIVTFLQGPSVSELAAQVMELLAASVPEPAPPPAPADPQPSVATGAKGPGAEDVLHRVAALSDDEVAAMLRDLYGSRRD